MLKRLLAAVGVMSMMLAFIALAPDANAQYVPGQPGFIIDPDTMPEGGGTANASGVGCEPGSNAVFTINGQSVGTTTASSDPDGRFATVLQIPSSLGPGEYTVVVTCGSVTMTNGLTITAVPTSTPSQGGSSLPRTGTNSMMLVKIGLALGVVGGLFVLGARKKRARV